MTVYVIRRVKKHAKEVNASRNRNKHTTVEMVLQQSLYQMKAKLMVQKLISTTNKHRNSSFVRTMHKIVCLQTR